MSGHQNYVDLSIKAIEARLDGFDRALILKTQETDRRLEEHNKLREEVLIDRAMFVRQDSYALNQRAHNEWKATVDHQLTQLMVKYDSRMTTANWIAVIAVCTTVVNLILFMLQYVK